MILLTKLIFGDVLMIKGVFKGEWGKLGILAKVLFCVALLNLCENMKNKIILAHQKKLQILTERFYKRYTYIAVLINLIYSSFKYYYL